VVPLGLVDSGREVLLEIYAVPKLAVADVTIPRFGIVRIHRVVDLVGVGTDVNTSCELSGLVAAFFPTANAAVDPSPAMCPLGVLSQ